MNIAIIYGLLFIQACLNAYFVWWMKNRWPANGFVRLPKKYQKGALKREADKQAARAVSPDVASSRVRRARLKR